MKKRESILRVSSVPFFVFPICLSFCSLIRHFQNPVEDFSFGFSSGHRALSKLFLSDPVGGGLNYDSILLVLDNQESLKFCDYKKEDFPISSFGSITDLTSSYREQIQKGSYLNTGSFRRILKIEPSQGKKFSQNDLEVLKDIYFVESAERVFSGKVMSAPQDPYYSTNHLNYQYYLHNIDLASAWDIEEGSSSVMIGLMDTGVYVSHEDLDSSRFPSSYTYDAVGLNRSAFSPSIPHGTMCAGIMGAISNTTGIAGITKNITFALIRADDPNASNHETIPAVIAGLNQAQSWGLKILNFSGGFYENSSSLKAAFKNFEGLVVVASGNENLNLDSTTTPEYPTEWKLKNVISVGASGNNADEARWFSSSTTASNYGSTKVHLFAPGYHITSTGISSTSDYIVDDGTSFAAPQVAAAAGLILSNRPTARNVDIKKTLLDNVDYNTNLSSLCISHGRLNLRKCLQYPKTHTIHSYDYEVINHSSTKHRYCCECGEYTLGDHYFDSYNYATQTKHKVTCSECGYYYTEAHVWNGGSTWYSGSREYGMCALCNHSFPL